jgi:predicted Zn finger-like uncharacterized protein
MIEVQCTSCHTRYRIDEQVLPEGTPTFKCSRCGHVFTFEPREEGSPEAPAEIKADPRADGRQDGPKPESPPPAAAAPAEAAAANPPPPERQPPPDAEPPAKAAAGPTPPAAPAEAAAEQPRSPGDQARRTEEFFSRLFAEKKKDEADPAENLAFDFRDEEPSPDQARSKSAKRRNHDSEQAPDSGKWEVGDDSTFDESAGEAAARNIFRVEDEPPPRKRRAARAPEPAAEDDEFVDEDDAPIYNRGLTHSARFFVMVFLIMGLGFGAMTLLIHNSPAAAAELLSRFPVIGSRFEPPTTPARLVALRGVNASYQRGKDGRDALVVTGDAENVAMEPLHVVQIAASLRDDSQRTLASQAVYCGNNFSAKMAGQMTSHEIEFFEKLDPPKTFALEPSSACQFVIVFIDPPAGVNSFAMSVEQAVPAASEAAAAPPS